ncbi:hypothetical protein BDY21DRAFT_128425 [Lineolata rhizophorae]|uniref:Uncharacterized protein n=1 Tax=Lineolata rhizophorae TaxID=578093 RepID=A0A6A6NNF5_9PEZI|nr:hypothetical protein BDY21DRAFT_128425 [Lineolata rhizophorae]
MTLYDISELAVSDSPASWPQHMRVILPRMRTLDFGQQLSGIAVSYSLNTISVHLVTDEKAMAFYADVEMFSRPPLHWSYFRLSASEYVTGLWVRRSKTYPADRTIILYSNHGRVLCPGHHDMNKRSYVQVIKEPSNTGLRVAVDECERYPSARIELIGSISRPQVVPIPAQLSNYSNRVRLADIGEIETFRLAKRKELLGSLIKSRTSGTWTSFGAFRLDGARERFVVDPKNFDPTFLRWLEDIKCSFPSSFPSHLESQMTLNWISTSIRGQLYWID